MGRCVSRTVLNRFLDGELAPAGADAVREHLAACPACARMLDEMRTVDEAIRGDPREAPEVPDLAAHVTEELHRRGAFLRARVAAAQRRAFGERLISWRLAASLSVAALLVAIAFVGMDHLTRAEWARRTAPVVVDAERVLVRLVYTEAPDDPARLAWAREEARRLALSDRLAQAQSGAEPALADDLAYLATTFALLVNERPLPPDLIAQLGAGEVLGRAMRLHEALGPGD